MTTIISYIAAFGIGTLFGSFFYTLSLRYSSGEIGKETLRALFSRSRCPSCDNPISPLYLTPILGYLILRGRCRKCGSGISWLYPAMEILYGAIAVLIAGRFGFTILAFNMFLLSGTAVCISLVDLKTLTIPNSLVIAFAVLSAYPIVLNYDIKDNLFGLLVLFAFFLVILLIFPGSFGAGDLKLASAIGLLSGFELSIVILEISLITGAVVGIIYAVKTRRGLKTKIPFAPFLAFGLIVSMLFGREILLVYYRIIF